MKHYLADSSPVSRVWNVLMDRQAGLTRAAWKHLAGYLVLTTAPFIYLDLYAPEKTGWYSLMSLVSWALGYILFIGLMDRGGFLETGKRSGVGTYFVLGLAIGIPVFAGMLVFVVPGVILLARWLPSYSRALVAGEGVGEAMRWSWRKSAPFQWPIMLSTLVPLLGYASSFAMLGGYEIYFDQFDEAGYVLAVVLWNSSLSIGMAWLSVAGVAAYGLLASRESEASDVFH